MPKQSCAWRDAPSKMDNLCMARWLKGGKCVAKGKYAGIINHVRQPLLASECPGELQAVVARVLESFCLPTTAGRP